MMFGTVCYIKLICYVINSYESGGERRKNKNEKCRFVSVFYIIINHLFAGLSVKTSILKSGEKK